MKIKVYRKGEKLSWFFVIVYSIIASIISIIHIIKGVFTIKESLVYLGFFLFLTIITFFYRRNIIKNPFIEEIIECDKFEVMDK